jgi:hypothetical protein
VAETGLLKRRLPRLAWLAPVVLALAVPVPREHARMAQSPTEAARRAEREMPALGLVWGKLRGWERIDDGWSLLWQPAHGAWLVRAWVPNGPGEVRWRLEVARWLPGARLSQGAARVMLGHPAEPGSWREQLGRRDWLIGDRQLAGALPAGSSVPQPARWDDPTWPFLLGGLLLAGALARVVFPGVVAVGWRRSVYLCLALLAAAVPLATAIGVRSFQPGVRPWVTQLAFLASALGVLAAAAVAIARYAPKRGSAAAWSLPLVLAIGLLAGRLHPHPRLLDLAGLGPRLLIWAGLSVVGGWLVVLAAEGLRDLLEPIHGVRPVLLATGSVLAVLGAGPWTGPACAVLVSAAIEKGAAMWLGVAAVWGWIVGSVLAGCGWAAPLRDAAVLLTAACLVAALALLRGNDSS